jgi:hypothetical protein
MKFFRYLASQHVRGSDHVKLAYQISDASHDFPSHLGTKGCVFNWLKKYDYHSDIIDAFRLAWNEFESVPYCTITKQSKLGGRKKRLSY